MNYQNYKFSRDAAWRLLVDLGICELPVKVSDVCKKLDIDVLLYQATDGTGGKCRRIKGKYTIYVNADDPPERQRFTTAHELGHILLGHVGKHKLVNREPQPDDNPIEQAANVFAVRLLAPACVLHELNVHSAEDIARICNISQQAAQFRFQRLKVLNERNKFYISPLERTVKMQFDKYIEENKL